MIDFRNIDCMVGMREYPDKYFDLAIVDPPYGDGTGGGGTTDLANASKGTSIHMLGNAGKWATHTRRTLWEVDLQERAEHWRRNTEKNCFVGRRAGAGVF